MGFWNDGITGSSSRPRSRSGSRSRTSASKSQPDRRASTRGAGDHYASQPSFTRSAASFFSGGSSGTPRGRSYNSRARPRSGFVARVRKFLRDLYEYMKKNPTKVFFLVIMPLITGGVLTKLLATVGIRLPAGLQRMVGSQMNRDVNSERYYARGGARDFQGEPGMGGGLPGIAAGLGTANNVASTVQSVMGIAKMFM